MVEQKRQQRMRRGAGDDLDEPLLLKFTKCGNEVPGISIVTPLQPLKSFMIKSSQPPKVFLPVVTVNFLLRQSDQLIEVAAVAGLQQWIAQHGAERGRERERD